MSESPGERWMRCQYFAFWDVPLVLVIHERGQTLLLGRRFDEALDDYPPDYEVWELEPMEPEAALTATWEEIERRKVRRVQDRPVKALEFHPEREREGDRFYAWYRVRADG